MRVTRPAVSRWLPVLLSVMPAAVQSGQYLPGQVTRVQLACQASDALAAGAACTL